MKRSPGGAGDCVDPDVVSFSNGTAIVSAVVPEGQFETVKSWVDDEDLEKLSGLEVV
jgi:hypothetical protein